MSAEINKKIVVGLVMVVMAAAWSFPLGPVGEPAPIDRALHFAARNVEGYQRAWDRFKVGARGYGIWIQCETVSVPRAGCFMAFGDNLYSLSFVESDTLGIIVQKNYTVDGRTIARKERVFSADEFMKRFEPLAYWIEHLYIAS